MHQVVITLGSNIDKERNLPAAVRLLAEGAEVVAVSPVYETAPVGPAGQPPFLNAAVLLRTDQSAAALKDGLLRRVEAQLGRQRTDDRYAPRPIDTDIALYDDAVFDYTPADGRPRHVPDPGLIHFAHCLLPVADLLPDMPHPETGQPLAALAAPLRRDPTIRLRPDVGVMNEPRIFTDLTDDTD
ncbi:2-amino-4-hydroxy-6-hydroxymethyldihydropteridine diphosphokinase [Promineifilum sp.]|uniref:2-amino-4-hydroxy-6- hydroxymethyldihydropteridine diphosphokinase n=1 Tax=Promineifilum sp. TaxID=2664178 RepID=UPI0035B24870